MHRFINGVITSGE